MMVGHYLPDIFLMRNGKAGIAADMDYAFNIFPRLKERMNQAAGTMSGGEQQMLAIARALMSQPKCLMLDEPSLGIAPNLVRSIFDQIVAINKERGLTILLVEQNANLALGISHHGYVLETGRVILEDSAAALPNALAWFAAHWRERHGRELTEA